MVHRTEAAVVCERCKHEIRWSGWQLFNVVLEDFPYSSSVAEKREGRLQGQGIPPVATAGCGDRLDQTEAPVIQGRIQTSKACCVSRYSRTRAIFPSWNTIAKWYCCR
jgi:hypothetical protein